MKYCKRCLQTDTRPNTKFSDDGICPACQYFETLKNVDLNPFTYSKKECLIKFFQVIGAGFIQTQSNPNFIKFDILTAPL